jgi:hypothetical protein
MSRISSGSSNDGRVESVVAVGVVTGGGFCTSDYAEDSGILRPGPFTVSHVTAAVPEPATLVPAGLAAEAKLPENRKKWF